MLTRTAFVGWLTAILISITMYPEEVILRDEPILSALLFCSFVLVVIGRHSYKYFFLAVIGMWMLFLALLFWLYPAFGTSMIWLGAFANTLVITANGGKMPCENFEEVKPSPIHCSANGTRLRLLNDRFVHGLLSKTKKLSIGDILIYAGASIAGIESIVLLVLA